MATFNLLTILPELFILNTSFFLLWVGLYMRKAWPSYSLSTFINYSILIYLLTFALLLNNPISESFSFSSNCSNTFNALIMKLITLMFSILVTFSYLSTENTIAHNTWGVEVNTIRLLMVSILLFLISTNNLIYMFFMFEVLSLSTYILVGYRTKNSVYLSEATIKYFLIGTLFSIIMIYAIALLYWATGLVNLSDLILYFHVTAMGSMDNNNVTDIITILGVSLLLISFLFKLASAPFHQWAPDVYEGTSISSMFFLAVIPKIALLSILLKLEFFWIFPAAQALLCFSVVLSSVISYLGLFQKNFKRLLTYSMINNNAFFLLAIVSASSFGSIFLIFFLITYSFTLVGLFGLLQSFRTRASLSLVVNIWSFSNLFFIDKARSLCFALLLFSSAGIPPLVGFIAKFLLLSSAISGNTNFQYLTLVIIIFSAITCFYYIRLVKVMAFSKKSKISFLQHPSLALSYVISTSVILMFVLFIKSDLIINILLLQVI